MKYVVKPGDCLWKIAERELNNPQRWLEIYKDNVDIIGEDPNLIYPGQELELRIQGVE